MRYNSWERTVYYNECNEEAKTWFWDFPEGKGPILESDTDPFFHDESWDDGFAEGYDLGYEHGVADTEFANQQYDDQVETELVDKYKREFVGWVAD